MGVLNFFLCVYVVCTVRSLNNFRFGHYLHFTYLNELEVKDITDTHLFFLMLFEFIYNTDSIDCSSDFFLYK